MTTKQAQAEAVRRWGKNGAVQFYNVKTATRHMLPRRYVGRVVLGMMFEVRGQGETWEEAFAAADKRADVTEQKKSQGSDR